MQDLNTGSENESQQVLEINTNCIELYKVLKLEGLADSGGMAKMLIGKGLVYVNGQIETRKRKKIIAGDTVEYEGKQVSIRSNK
jgi:ribosome-associated protein